MLTNEQYKELWKRIYKFQKDKGKLPNYVIINDMNVGGESNYPSTIPKHEKTMEHLQKRT